MQSSWQLLPRAKLEIGPHACLGRRVERRCRSACVPNQHAATCEHVQRHTCTHTLTCARSVRPPMLAVAHRQHGLRSCALRLRALCSTRARAHTQAQPSNQCTTTSRVTCVVGNPHSSFSYWVLDGLQQTMVENLVLIPSSSYTDRCYCSKGTPSINT